MQCNVQWAQVPMAVDCMDICKVVRLGTSAEKAPHRPLTAPIQLGAGYLLNTSKNHRTLTAERVRETAHSPNYGMAYFLNIVCWMTFGSLIEAHVPIFSTEGFPLYHLTGSTHTIWDCKWERKETKWVGLVSFPGLPLEPPHHPRPLLSHTLTDRGWSRLKTWENKLMGEGS